MLTKVDCSKEFEIVLDPSGARPKGLERVPFEVLITSIEAELSRAGYRFVTYSNPCTGYVIIRHDA
jgi:hypothetical protein